MRHIFPSMIHSFQSNVVTLQPNSIINQQNIKNYGNTYK